ncbi:MAG: hypothetical protein K8E24_014275 [Methanobacterium paludis]|nr:hypothetical protein [Methanobacterium paludis]
MQQCPAKSTNHENLIFVAETKTTQTDTDPNNSNILYTMVSQQFLEIVLHNGKHHAINTGNHRNGDNEVPDSRHIRLNQQKHSQYAIDTDFDDNSGHNTRNMSWCSRVCQGQPGMEGYKTSLYGKAYKETEEQSKAGNCWLGSGKSSDGFKIEGTRFYPHPHKSYC